MVTLSEEVKDCYDSWSGESSYPKDGYFSISEYVKNKENMISKYPDHYDKINLILQYNKIDEELSKIVDDFKKENKITVAGRLNIYNEKFTTNNLPYIEIPMNLSRKESKIIINEINNVHYQVKCELIELIFLIPNKFPLSENERVKGTDAYEFWLKIFNMCAMNNLSFQVIPNRNKYYKIHDHIIINKLPETLSFEQIAVRFGRIINKEYFDDIPPLFEDFYQMYLNDEKALCQRILLFLFSGKSKAMFAGVTPNEKLLNPLPVKVKNLILMCIIISNNDNLPLEEDFYNLEEFKNIDHFDDVYCLFNYIYFSDHRKMSVIDHPMIIDFLASKNNSNPTIL